MCSISSCGLSSDPCFQWQTPQIPQHLAFQLNAPGPWHPRVPASCNPAPTLPPRSSRVLRLCLLTLPHTLHQPRSGWVLCPRQPTPWGAHGCSGTRSSTGSPCSYFADTHADLFQQPQFEAQSLSKKSVTLPWPVWLSGRGVVLQGQGCSEIPAQGHTRAVGCGFGPGWGERKRHLTDVSLPLSPLPFPSFSEIIF